MSGICDTVTTHKCLPDTAARASWSAAVCGSCHQEAPNHYKPTQWVKGMHSDLSLAYLEGTAENNRTTQVCGRCHSAQGFARYAGSSAGLHAHLTCDGQPLDSVGGQKDPATIA